MAPSFHPCSTTLPGCVCPAPPPPLHPRSSQTPPIPPPPALGCCRTFLPPDPDGKKKEKERKEEGEVRRRGGKCISSRQFRGLYFLDQWRGVNGEVNDAHSATYLKQFQSHGRTRGAVGTSSSHFVTAGM